MFHGKAARIRPIPFQIQMITSRNANGSIRALMKRKAVESRYPPANRGVSADGTTRDVR
jgi:hypothetical protein